MSCGCGEAILDRFVILPLGVFALDGTVLDAWGVGGLELFVFAHVAASAAAVAATAAAAASAGVATFTAVFADTARESEGDAGDPGAAAAVAGLTTLTDGFADRACDSEGDAAVAGDSARDRSKEGTAVGEGLGDSPTTKQASIWTG